MAKFGGMAYGAYNNKKEEKKTKKLEQKIEAAKWDRPQTERQGAQARAWAGQSAPRSGAFVGSSTLGGSPATAKPTLLGG